MSQPPAAVPQKEPYALELKAGDYWWCACGLSNKQPFCDGSHQGSGISPVKFSQKEDGKVWLCGCKQTLRVPYCDGSHRALED